ncbi:hypothetical protein lbkm_3112 [Lachnospiraceae bacterium KM106-2]|nr:hypothetical protein lbkm_3112 [Lachnospiraceae bacterium KM106-2]
MNYKRAEEVIPVELLTVIQEYVNGEYLYIPRKSNQRKSWGETSGYKKQLKQRNDEIIKSYQAGQTVKELAERYYLSEKSIYRIMASQ